MLHQPPILQSRVPISTTKDVSLTDLKLFARAHELGSLAAAARALNLPKASATRQLQRLESALGQRLLHRGGGRFAATEEGRELLLKLVEPIAAIDEALAALASPGAHLAGRLRIAAPYNFGRTTIAPRLPPFLARHPGVVVSLELSSRPVDLLADEADIAVRVGNPHGDRLVARRLATDRLLLCAAPSWLTAHPAPSTPQDLAAHRLLDFRPEPLSGGFTLTGANGRTERIAAPVVLRSNEPDVLVQAARRCAGVALVPRSFAEADLKAGTLVALLERWELPTLDINALYAPGRRHSPRIRAFLDHLAAEPERGPM